MRRPAEPPTRSGAYVTLTAAEVAAPVDARRPVPWRIAAGVLIFVLGLTGVWILSGHHPAPDPAQCDRLEATAIERQDITVIYEMDRLGCPNPPYDAVRWP
jgi:hypothetical protein